MGDAIQQAIDARTSPPTAPVTPSAMRLIPVTDLAIDGPMVHRMYSYWANSWISGATIDVFAGHADGTVHFFSVEKDTGAVQRLGALLPYAGTGEGWYWDAEGWVYLCEGPRLRRVNPFTGENRVVMDVSARFPGCDIWQGHSSDDGQAHSATLRQVTSDGPYLNLGTVIQHSSSAWDFFARKGVLDESQIDASGRHLIIKEDDDNRIITLATGDERTIRNVDGALGHSDCGDGFAVGENDQAGACVYLDLATLEQRELFKTWDQGYVAVRGQRCVHSGAETIDLVALDGSGLTPLTEHGANAGNDYDRRVKANLDPTGAVATYMVDGVVYLLILP